MFTPCYHRGSRHSINGAAGTRWKAPDREQHSTKSLYAAKQDRGVPWALEPLPTTPCLDRSAEATGYGEGAHTPAKIDAF